MFKLNSMFFFLVSVFYISAVSASTPVLKKIPVENVFSPRGYDTLDSSEIVIQGDLPNACHKNPKISYTIKENTILVEVKSLYYQQPNPFCPEVILPFIRTIDLGLLEKGKYKVVINEGTPSEKNTFFKVRDPILGEERNQIYANVEYIERKRTDGKITLYGHNPSDCFILDKVRILDNGKNTLSVLPRMEKISDFCPKKMVPFKIDVTLPIEQTKSDTLIHVRTMYGNSINTIY